MDERGAVSGGTERPVETPGPAAERLGPEHLSDPRALTILTTEHWSLLTARSLVYNETFTRATMFLTFLTGTLVALGFVSQASGYTTEFLVIAVVLLGLDLFVGLATLGRISAASVEEIRTLQGMNRLRHAYFEMAPTVEPYFSTSPHDDLYGVLMIYGATPEQPSLLGNFLHGLTTMPGMVGTITAAVGGAFFGTIGLLLGATPIIATVVGLIAFAILFGVVWRGALAAFERVNRTLEVRFPSPLPGGGEPPFRT
jgi:hypothetical protein